MDKFDLYSDIAARTGGNIYVGVVGPVRTGKSTFIKKVMEGMVVENISDSNDRVRAVDELPQSADGKTIMTTQPKFVPNEAVKVSFRENLDVNLRLIDCVGYMVDGALGVAEGGKERLVRTPWFEEEIPFSKAAEIGTEKVIKQHSTIGILVTTDGTVTNIERGAYLEAEARVVKELKEIGKPFAIVLNTREPSSDNAKALAAALNEKYDAPVVIKDVLNMTEDDITEIMESVLLEFPVKLINGITPEWMKALDVGCDIIKELIKILSDIAENVVKMRDTDKIAEKFEDFKFFKRPAVGTMDTAVGHVDITLEPADGLFYQVASEECGIDVTDELKLLTSLKRLRIAKDSYDKIKAALDDVEDTGYGVVMPTMEEMELEEPEIVKQNGQFGVRLRASAPSLHILRVDVDTEVCPIVGTEQQGEELVKSIIDQFEGDSKAIWDTNIFGKSLSVLVNDGMTAKLNAMPEEARVKLRRTLGRIINEGRGGVICILL
ncbi:MAG: stage IV sporulation protein A [Christensenellales bacterium]|nr:stage IV sporulation protein A [Clostridia bacterium]